MNSPETIDSMGRTSIQVSEELADELYDRKNRGESYEDVVWRLIDQHDTDAGAVDSETTHVDQHSTTPPAGETVSAVVEQVSDGWEDTDERMHARRAAAVAVLQHTIDTGNAVGKADAIDEFLPEYAVEGQGDDTWWRKNIRPVLSDVGDYSNGQHGYVVDLDA